MLKLLRNLLVNSLVLIGFVFVALADWIDGGVE